MADSTSTHLYFLGLSAVGYDCLWGRMMRGAAIPAIKLSKSSGVFPNGTLLRRSFLGWPAFDAFVTPAVIFYDNLLDSGFPPHRMLLVSLFSSMQTTAHCMLILGWHDGRRPIWADMEFIMWGMLNQTWGAAVVYPIYCFAHMSRFWTHEGQDGNQIGPLDVEDAVALIPTAIIGSLAPAMLLLPTFTVGCSSHIRQGLIAFYRLTPLALGLIRPLFSFLVSKTSLGRDKRSPEQVRIVARELTTCSLVLSAFVAVAGHLYPVLGSVLSGGFRVFKQVFWPGSTPNNMARTAIADAAHEFLQFDVIIITAALVPYASMILSSSPGLREYYSRNTSMAAKVLRWAPSRWAALGALCILLSPGGVLASVLAARCWFE